MNVFCICAAMAEKRLGVDHGNQGKKEETEEVKAVVHTFEFARNTGDYKESSRIKLQGLSDVVKSIRRAKYISNLDIPAELFYEVSAGRQKSTPAILPAPVIKLNLDPPSNLLMDSVSGRNKTKEEVPTSAVLPSIGRPYRNTGIKEVEDDTSSSTDALLMDDYYDTECDLESEALELGISTQNTQEPCNWTYDCIVDQEGVSIQSVVDGFNMFLIQSQYDNTVKLERVSIRGNRLFGHVTPMDASLNALDLNRPTATLTELPLTPHKSSSVPSDMTKSKLKRLSTSSPVRKIKKTQTIDVQNEDAIPISTFQQQQNQPQTKTRPLPEYQVDDFTIDQIKYDKIIIRLPGRTERNQNVVLRLDYEKYRSVAELDLSPADKIIKILQVGKMFKKYYYQCDYSRGTIQFSN